MEKMIPEDSIISYYENLLVAGDFSTILTKLISLPDKFYLKGIIVEANIVLGRFTEASRILNIIVQGCPQTQGPQLNKEQQYLLYLQGIFSLEKGENSKAKEYLEESYKYLDQMTRDNFYYKMMFALIRCYIQTKDVNKAKNLIDIVQNTNLPPDGYRAMQTTFLIGNYYLTKGEWDTALEHLNNALSLAEKLPNKADLAIILSRIANIYRRRGDFKQAIPLLEKEYELQKSVGNEFRQGITLLNTGIMYIELGDYQKSLAYENLALKILEKIPNLLSLATCLQVIANNYYCLGRFEESYSNQKQCLSIARELGDKSFLSDTLLNLGGLVLLQGKLYEAKDMIEESVSIIEPWGEKQEIAKRYHDIGKIYSELGEYKEALITYQKAYDLHKATGTTEYILETAIGILKAYGELEDFSGFDSFLVALPRPTNQPIYLLAYTLIIESMSAFYKRKLTEAKSLLEQAVVVEGLQFTWQMYIYEQLISIELAEVNTRLLGSNEEISEKDLAKIPSLLAAMELLCKNKNIPSYLCKNYILQSKCALLYNDYSKARVLLNQASEIASMCGLPLHVKLIEKEEAQLNSENISSNDDSNENNSNLRENVNTILAYLHDLGKILANLENPSQK